MIHIDLRRNLEGHLWSFTAKNHSNTDVCAAVSLLLINTANSIEALTDAVFQCEHDDSGGFLSFALTGYEDYGRHEQAGLIMDTMYLGLTSVVSQYPRNIRIIEHTSTK